MDDVWCSLDMATDIALADPFWQTFTDSAVSSIGDGNAYFGIADVDLVVSADKVEGMADIDASSFFGGDGRLVLQQYELTQSSASSSLSSKRSLSVDSGGSSGSFTLDAAALAVTNVDASWYQAPAPPPVAHHPLPGGCDHDDEAIMRAMMAVMSSSSASPSSSASASTSSQPRPFCRDSIAGAQPRGGNGHVMVKSSPAMPPGQQEEARTASGNVGQQLYHMMSERKRREKLNDSFQTLRLLLPPCSKKDKTTVLTNAASYLKTLEAQVSELEEKNTKLEKHIPTCEDAGATAMGAPHQQRQRAKVQISKARSEEAQLVNLTVMVMVECDVVDLVLRILECLRWMKQISVLSVDADTYSPQVLLKAIASIKLRIMDGDWNEASFHEAMTKAANDATSSPSCAPLVLTT